MSPLERFRWQSWYLAGTIRVLQMVSSFWGIHTLAAQRELEDVRRRLNAAYYRQKKGGRSK